MSAASCSAAVGRPRAFDKQTALEKALEVFWIKGFDGASLSDLTSAMGINKPSMYSAFGNKEQLFLQAIEFYENRPCSFFKPALEQPTAYKVAEAMLLGAAKNMSDSTHPQGCVMVQGALACSEAAAGVKEELIKRRQQSQEKVQARFELAIEQGDLPKSADPAALARYLNTIIQGISIQASSGATEAQLNEVAQLALASFPRG
ncbi:TetR/AcrR family transcriptional regulator [Aliiglaciecola sp. 3_MG-2023]|uniref:TetR/AcrR family transcriptional regulator n=1 Tax=Aliiglaciecola sp. 3_MG-2023 TaxID=3062644 RepID=UPI0026E269AA|nr:TetR/AcrR family transcriptional regulator [Aliiglaciecola sp. 3_MG-2023]MDO6694743.1 TetR/AcrR family transcriptional regulator [Aliiglaciecola sp. 3_MG-2023]